MTARGLFSAANCQRIDLRYRVTLDKFAVPRFLEFFKIEPEAQEARKAVVCRTLDPERLDYHIHFHWSFRTESVTLNISFHSGVFGTSEGEHEPYAEQFMSWLGGFFGNGTAFADLHAEFDYPLEARQSRFPLPLKVNLSDGLEAEIGGIFMSFPSIPEGISGAEVKQGKKRLVVELLDSARTNFQTFDLQSEVDRLSSFALRLTETKNK